MPANLSEGVLWQSCSNCGGVYCEDARRRGKVRMVCGFAIELLAGVVARRLQSRRKVLMSTSKWKERLWPTARLSHDYE